MIESRVLVFEDEPRYITEIGDALLHTQHEIVGVGEDLGAAHRLLKLVERGILAADVVLLDANLDPTTTSREGADGRELFNLMKTTGLVSSDGVDGLKIINISRTPWYELGIRAHKDPGKYSMAALPTILDNLAPTDAWMKRTT